jgi:hypothetical protein
MTPIAGPAHSAARTSAARRKVAGARLGIPEIVYVFGPAAVVSAGTYHGAGSRGGDRRGLHLPVGLSDALSL